MTTTAIRAEKAARDARALLAKQEAKNRLRDILPEEVSVVNRAANQRKFLVVKSQENQR